MKLLLFLLSLLSLAAWGDYQNSTFGIMGLCGLVLCAITNPRDVGEGIEASEEFEWEASTEQGLGDSNL